MSVSSRIVGAVLLVAFVPLVAGCSGEVAEPVFSSAPSSASPTESATSDAPQRENPKAFIRRFVAVSDEMQNSLDSTEYRSISAASCGSCTDFADRVDEIESGGGSIEFEGTKVIYVRKAPASLGSERWVYKVKAGRTEYTESSGASLQAIAGGVSHRVIKLEPDGLTWKAAYWATLASEPKW